MAQQYDIDQLGENAVIINRRSFEDLYNQHWDKIYAICYNNIRDIEIAREMVQDIFRSLWERREKLQLSDAGRYLVRAAKLKTFEYIRNKVNQQKHLETNAKALVANVNCTEEQVLFNELKNQVNNLVDNFPPQCRKVFKMSREHGLSNRDIANELLISERAVEYHISKAIGILKLNLSSLYH